MIFDDGNGVESYYYISLKDMIIDLEKFYLDLTSRYCSSNSTLKSEVQRDYIDGITDLGHEHAIIFNRFKYDLFDLRTLLKLNFTHGHIPLDLSYSASHLVKNRNIQSLIAQDKVKIMVDNNFEKKVACYFFRKCKNIASYIIHKDELESELVSKNDTLCHIFTTNPEIIETVFNIKYEEGSILNIIKTLTASKIIEPLICPGGLYDINVFKDVIFQVNNIW